MSTFFDIHTHRTENPFAICNAMPMQFANIANSKTKNLFSLGIHPLFAENSEAQFAEMKKWISYPQIIAVGEVGMDKRVENLPKQSEIFEKQMQLAAEYEKPVIIHCVRATCEVLKITNNFNGIRIVFHGFRGKPKLAEQILKTGAYLSLGEKSLFAPGMLRAIPAERLFLETDESDKPIAEIYAQAAEILNVSVAELQEKIARNVQQVFPKLHEKAQNCARPHCPTINKIL